MSSNGVAIRVSGLSKVYQIGHEQEKHSTLAETMLARVTNPLKRMVRDEFWALKDVNFEVQKGDVVGIIGRNGAGKSTLLKVLSRITEPTKGRVELFGRVGSLLEVGTGFHPELTGRENIYLNGAILGMRRAEIDREFDAIVAFSEVDKFLDTPVKRYSSGMYVRLAFAVAAHLNPEILIVDEVLAVGDVQFQKKCLGKMQDISRSQGRTVLFVSHNMAAVQSLCTRAILMKAGRVERAGPTAEVVSDLMRSGVQGGVQILRDRKDRSGSSRVRCESIAIRDLAGNVLEGVKPNEPFEIVVGYGCKDVVLDLGVSIDIDSMEGIRIATLYSGFVNQVFRATPPGAELVCRINGLNLRPEQYKLNVMFGNDSERFDFVDGAFALEVLPMDVYGSGRLPGRGQGVLVPDYGWTQMVGAGVE